VRITVVPTVKAYPALLSGLEEAVCVAGFRTGILEQPAWARLFPIPFRELDEEQQFRKWQEITVDADPSPRDHRPESLLPRSDSLHAGRILKLSERRQLVDSMPHESMCGVIEQQRLHGTSLGVVRPRRVIDVLVEERDPEEVQIQQQRVESAAAQQKLFGPALTPLEVIPHRFLYRYLCEDPNCGIHNQGIIDWEISAAYRKWRRQYPVDFVERIRRKWLDELCSPNCDTRFFGVFWPRR
jgi:hypothetical protein